MAKRKSKQLKRKAKKAIEITRNETPPSDNEHSSILPSSRGDVSSESSSANNETSIKTLRVQNYILNLQIVCFDFFHGPDFLSFNYF